MTSRCSVLLNHITTFTYVLCYELRVHAIEEKIFTACAQPSQSHQSKTQRPQSDKALGDPLGNCHNYDSHHFIIVVIVVILIVILYFFTIFYHRFYFILFMTIFPLRDFMVGALAGSRDNMTLNFIA